MVASPVVRSLARPPWPLLFALSGVGFLLSATGAGYAALPAFCGEGTAWLLRVAALPEAIALALALTPPGRLAAEWALMLLAMTPPLLAAPLVHVRRSSLPRRRLRASALFVLGYVAALMAAGPILMGLALVLYVVAGAQAWIIALGIALLWSASPWQQAALNRTHRLRRIGLFGAAADRDCLAYGAIHGAGCIAACWAWMLLPLTAGSWHVAAMLLAGAMVLTERLALDQRPRWRLPALVLPLARLATRHG